MSLEQNLAELTFAINHLIAKLDGQSITPQNTASTDTPQKAEAQATKPAPTSQAETTNESVKKFQEIRDELKKLDPKMALELLEKYGTKKVSAIKESDYPALMKDIQTELSSRAVGAEMASTPTPTIGDVRSALTKLPRDKGIAILKQFGAQKLSQLKPGDYIAAIQAAQAGA